eukprot:scaffold11494_cov61-Cyclotella_meneghiniana.AAC.2
MRRYHRESRQPEDEGRSGKSKSSSVQQQQQHANHPIGGSQQQPPSPLSPCSAKTQPPISPFPKTRCYRLNLEKPFDISSTSHCSSPLYRNRDYSGPINEADLPPVQGPAEYYPPPHLCRDDELRRHPSFSQHTSSSTLHNHHRTSSSVDVLMTDLQVSESEGENQKDEISVAISTARIFRGITVDRNGVILTQNARAMRSRKSSNGNDTKNKLGEKSRQAAKIDKAKDLIDDVLENGGGGDGGNDENDPSKIVSLYVMGEYEELNDLVRDGSKKLRESKSLSDEAMYMYNRPRPVPPYISSPSNQSVITGMTGSMTNISGVNNSQDISYNNANSSSNNMTTTMVSSPTNRKRVLDRSRYKNVPRSAPPKLKSHPRDTRPSNRSRKDGTTGSSRSSSGGVNNAGSSQQQQQQQQSHHHSSAAQHPHYFREQCNFFPGAHSNWAEALGFSVNSLWNCGANNGHMSPTSHSVSPVNNATGYAVPDGGGGGHHPHHHGRSSSNAYSNSATPGGGYGHGTSPNGYHYGYEEGRDPINTGSGHGGAGGRYDGYHGRSRNGGVRDTVVM